jgi:hypothetical protein
MTGSFADAAASSGRHTFMNRQSSDEVVDILPEPGGKAAWGQSAPNWLASRSRRHASKFS